MKTKSKRFLNLATLSLALLGTTLLMGRPVKAEVVLTRGTQQSGENAEDSDAKIKKEYLERYKLDKLEGQGQYYKDRFLGYLKGHKDGFKGIERPEPGDIPVPTDFQGDPQDYKDGYEEGFAEGRYKRYPLEAGDASHDNEGRQEENKIPGTSHDNEGRQEENKTPGTSHDNEGRQEESDNRQEDIFTPIVEAIIGAVLEAWTHVLNWFTL
ncbi:TPA: hypothetical protein VB390_000510 [Streptococcus pyogenes]|nr:hypothetical protein [Streptococcus pyogenes]